MGQKFIIMIKQVKGFEEDSWGGKIQQSLISVQFSVNQFLFSLYLKVSFQKMNFRKSLRSVHHSQSVKKIQLNPLDLQDCNLYPQSAQSTKQSENSILNKLLLQPPSLKSQQSSKLSLQTNKKYQPKFAKPDVENLIQENINLKNVVQCHVQTANQLKVRIIQLDKKIKLLEKGLQKVQKEELEGPKQAATGINSKHLTITKPSIPQHKHFTATQQQSQPYIKPTTIHTQILKKKIADLTAQNISAQKQLKFLKKLPNITVYEQNDTQKEHLMAETIRLKSIISSLSEQPDNEQSEKFQNQFMRLMKQENEKLKATIRLLQNDKILLKSRQTIQNKLNSDLKKQIEHYKTKLLYKQSQLEKINNQNKNLLFKKTTQFRQQQEKKQNQLVQQLRAKLVTSENQRGKLQQNNQLYAQENMNLKQKEKNLTQEIAQMQTKYDKVVKKLNQEIEELQFELNNVKNDYMNLLNSGALKKKKSLAVNKQNSNVGMNSNNMRDSFHGTMSSYMPNQKINFTSPGNNTNSKTYSRPVKWQDVSLPMAHLYLAMKQNQELTVESLIKNVEELGVVRCGDLVSMFGEEPFCMNRKQAMKLARYICEDESLSANSKVLENENLTIQSSLAKTILTSSLQKMVQKLSPSFIPRWSSILKKTLKLPQMINQFLSGKSHVTRNQFCSMINRTSRQKVEAEEYEYLMIKCMDVDVSGEEFVLAVAKVSQFVQKLADADAEELFED